MVLYEGGTDTVFGVRGGWTPYVNIAIKNVALAD